MRDPDLVHRAERAAAALEEAWIRWRAWHGLSTGQLPPVSSYVGYSIEEPWGQPRVVFGIEAAEAERLAAILDGRDYAGPMPAELNGGPGWRQPQAPPPVWTVPSGSQGVPPQGFGPERSGAPAGRPSVPVEKPSVPVEKPSAPVEKRGAPVEKRGAVAGKPGAPAEKRGAVAGKPGATAEKRGAVAGKPGATAEKRGALTGKPDDPVEPASDLVEPASDLVERASDLVERAGDPVEGAGTPAESRSVRPDARGARVPSAGQLSSGADAQLPPSAPPRAGTPPGSAVRGRPDPRPVSAAPAPEQPAPPVSGKFAAAPAVPEGEVDYGRSDELTTEPPILPRALRRAAALADAPAELPDHEAAYLQELAARPGIVALHPQSARPDAPAAGTQPATSSWRTAPYLSRPAPYLGQLAASTGQPQNGASSAGSGLVPAADAGPAAEDAARPATDTAAADGPPVTQLMPVSRLNRSRTPGEPGQWPEAGDPAQASSDTTV